MPRRLATLKAHSAGDFEPILKAGVPVVVQGPNTMPAELASMPLDSLRIDNGSFVRRFGFSLTSKSVLLDAPSRAMRSFVPRLFFLAIEECFLYASQHGVVANDV